jgi:hypothetical protein
LLFGLRYGFEERHLWHRLPGNYDLLDFKKLLVGHLGYKYQDIICVTDRYEKLHPQQFLKKLSEFVDDTKDNEELILYFSGHGLEHKKHPELFCSSIMGVDFGVSGSEICKALVRVPRTSRILIIIDCCGSGALFDPGNKRYPYRCWFGWMRTSAKLPPNAIAIMATPTGVTQAYAGLHRTWTWYKSYFTEALIQVVLENSSVLDTRTLIAALDNKIQVLHGKVSAELIKRGYRIIICEDIRPSLYCSSKELNLPFFSIHISGNIF